MGLKSSAAILVLIAASLSAGATNCPAINDPGTLLQAGAAARTIRVSTASSRPVTLLVEGHPMDPQISIVDNDGNSEACAFHGDPTALYTATITSPRIKAGIAQWKAWVASREKACDPSVDSIGYFQPGATKIAVVFHGLSSSPQGMYPAIRLLLDQGYNVLAPRLSHHFVRGKDHDLDNAKGSDWVADSEKVYAIARQFVDPRVGQVTLVGYSLGGLLAGRLGIKYGDNVDRLVLFSPAIRMNATSSLASLLFMGSSFQEQKGLPILCKAGAGYLPASAGYEVENLMRDVEHEFGVASSPTIPILYNQIIVPYMVLTSPDDMAIDAPAIQSQCAHRSLAAWPGSKLSVCTPVSVANVAHEDMMQSLGLNAEPPLQAYTLTRMVSWFLRFPIPLQ